MITFELKDHQLKPIKVVEVLLDGKVCAVIYPEETLDGIKVVTAHYAGHGVDCVGIPAIHVLFRMQSPPENN